MSPKPRVRIMVPGNWRTLLACDLADLECEASTVGEALAWLSSAYPQVSTRLFTAGTTKVASWINIYLGEQNIRNIGGLDAAIVPPTDTLTIIQAVAGG